MKPILLYGVPGMKKGQRKQYDAHPKRKAAALQVPVKKGRKGKGKGKKAKAGKAISLKKVTASKAKVVAPAKTALPKAVAFKGAAKNAPKATAVKGIVTKTAKGQNPATVAKAAQRAALQVKAKIQRANTSIQKSDNALKKADLLQTRLEDLLSKATTDAQKSRLQYSLDTLQVTRTAHQDIIDKANQDLKDAGAPPTIAPLSEKYKFTELHEKGFLLWRELTLQEKRVNFQKLNDIFDEASSGLEDDLTVSVGNSLKISMARVQARLKAGDVSGIADIDFVPQSAINPIVNQYIKDAYEQGKKSASLELKVGKPATPLLKTQLMNMDSEMISQSFSTEVGLAAKQIAREGLAKGVPVPSVISSINSVAQEKASKMMVQVIGNVIGENLNKGRRLVFESNATDIKAYQRSEILDGRTCNTCMSLDERIVMGDDPMAQLDEVHYNCRGVWVPIMQNEEIDPNDIGLPSDITDAFDTIGGAPTVNAFTQLKKPINDSNADVQQEIKRRLNASAAIEKKYGGINK